MEFDTCSPLGPLLLYIFPSGKQGLFLWIPTPSRTAIFTLIPSFNRRIIVKGVQLVDGFFSGGVKWRRSSHFLWLWC